MTSPSESQSTDERTQALALANRLLDEPNVDPDDDLRMLSRWLIRRHETAENHRQTLIGIAQMDPETEGNRMRLWASDALSGYVETGEVSMKKQQDEINRLKAKLEEVARLLDEGAYRMATDEARGA
jgi:hypothetical protein